MKFKGNKLILNANYDNLRNIDSDDSMITSPEKHYLQSNSKNSKLSSFDSAKPNTFNASEKNISNIMKQKNSVTSMSEIIEKRDTNGKVTYLNMTFI